MLSGFLVATLLNLSPGVQLADSTGYRHVGLSDRIVRVDDEVQPQPLPSIDQMTRAQMETEVRRVEAERPSLAMPIVLLSVGVGAAVTGIVLAETGYLSWLSANALFSRGGRGLQTSEAILLGVGAVALVVGVVLIIVGAVKLKHRINERRSYGEKLDELHQRIDQGGTPQVPPPAEDPMVPPPPPPPQAGVSGPAPHFVLATF